MQASFPYCWVVYRPRPLLCELMKELEISLTAKPHPCTHHPVEVSRPPGLLEAQDHTAVVLDEPGASCLGLFTAVRLTEGEVRRRTEETLLAIKHL